MLHLKSVSLHTHTAGYFNVSLAFVVICLHRTLNFKWTGWTEGFVLNVADYGSWSVFYSAKLHYIRYFKTDLLHIYRVYIYTQRCDDVSVQGEGRGGADSNSWVMVFYWAVIISSVGQPAQCHCCHRHRHWGLNPAPQKSGECTCTVQERVFLHRWQVGRSAWVLTKRTVSSLTNIISKMWHIHHLQSNTS